MNYLTIWVSNCWLLILEHGLQDDRIVRPFVLQYEFGISMQYQFLILDIKYKTRIFVELLRLLLYYFNII
jgi:hypothetical protein